jgi:hypothetical protein
MAVSIEGELVPGHPATDDAEVTPLQNPDLLYRLLQPYGSCDVETIFNLAALQDRTGRTGRTQEVQVRVAFVSMDTSTPAMTRLDLYARFEDTWTMLENLGFTMIEHPEFELSGGIQYSLDGQTQTRFEARGTGRYRMQVMNAEN